ncbi:hypothetical protein PROFUN_07550 [Planoprotostelium fungivorum]|uniref:Transglutaminase-like domain-containing protein n=1 Tax=Planoprotostelium fungivorum TaxID=1890364 RepID=A0A2P6NLQ6_9EUKA|nr:hypothetical protein PROFUN_07550 [Planoprotostelium fungivorum]
MTGVSTEDQIIVGLPCGVLRDDADLSKLAIRRNARLVVLKSTRHSTQSEGKEEDTQPSISSDQKAPTPSPVVTEKPVIPTTKPTIQNPPINFDEWQDTCTCIFVSGPTVQPCYVRKTDAKRVCQGCAATCQIPGSVHPESSTARLFFECECGDNCLFLERKHADLYAGADRERLLDVLKIRRISKERQFDPNQMNQEQRQMLQRLMSGFSTVSQYEDPTMQAKARSTVPLKELKERVKKALGDRVVDESSPPFRSELLKQLVFWYKHEFFSWCNSPKCNQCGGETKGIGGAQPDRQEAMHQAHVVEVYRCTVCNSITRYPRYNDPAKLLETKSGRCGEWANCFTLLCRALQFEARYVMDFTDHVWTEVWSEEHEKWLHVDSCEALIDSPLVYEEGWGKKLSYIFSFSHEQMRDSIRRYSRDMNGSLSRRNQVTEEWLDTVIVAINRDRTHRLGLPQHRIDLLQEREEIALAAGHVTLSEDEKQGRISGSKEWRENRGELGSQTASRVEDIEQISVEFPNCRYSMNRDGTTRLVTVGTTKKMSDRLRLTSKISGQVGAAWLTDKVDVSEPFSVEFKFQITERGADGLAFVLQNEGPSAKGRDGSDLGYGGIPRSVAIEMDTYDSGTHGDPSGNHVSVNSRGELPNSAHHSFSLGCTRELAVQLADGGVHHVKVVYLDGSLYVYVDDLQRAVLKVKILLTDYLGSGQAWIGFTASTGGLSQVHDLLSFDYNTL